MSEERASLEKLLIFANKVRNAGGGNPINALIPAIPASSTECLIAKNLNFNCEVHQHGGGWAMFVTTKALAEKISEAIESRVFMILDRSGGVYYGIVLPENIGQIAEDFDKFQESFKPYGKCVLEMDEIQRKGIAELLPYVKESYREAHQIGTFNGAGELILC